jgi:hypothetical protein
MVYIFKLNNLKVIHDLYLIYNLSLVQNDVNYQYGESICYIHSLPVVLHDISGRPV